MQMRPEMQKSVYAALKKSSDALARQSVTMFSALWQVHTLNSQIQLRQAVTWF